MLCPKCAQPVLDVSVAVIDGEPLPVYQCDSCIVETTLLGADVEVNLTFAATADGRMFDPNTSRLLDLDAN